ncbi:hypothetical protein HDU85_001363 [Gaertneriomyces sp. JEL0708]|nr:hypothetical protein HDU85_001363 [Gaertneriomyces sp. JEL0708]
MSVCSHFGLAPVPVGTLSLSKVTRLARNDVETVYKVMSKFADGTLEPAGMDFQVWNWSKSELYGIVLGMFVKSGVVGDEDTLVDLLDFVLDVADGYLANPYHSFLHAVDVAYIVYWCLADLALAERLGFTPIEFVALILAALTHDILHPGVNNLFHVNARTELARLYRGQSVLEMHSVNYLEELLKKHNFVHTLRYGDAASLVTDIPGLIEEIAVEAVLNTDMCYHFDLLGHIGRILEAAGQGVGEDDDTVRNRDAEAEVIEEETFELSGDNPQFEFSVERIREPLGIKAISESPVLSATATTVNELPSSDVEEQAKNVVNASAPVGGLSINSTSVSATSVDGSHGKPTNESLVEDAYGDLRLTHEQQRHMINALLHAADISNAARPWYICKRWSDMVVEEFFLQGDKEKSMNLPVSPNMDRETTNPVQIGIDFNEYVVRPYFELLAELLPALNPFVVHLVDNKQTWEKMARPEQPSTAVPIPGESISRGRRLSLAAGTIEIPQLFDKYIKNRYKMSRSLSSGRSRGAAPYSSYVMNMERAASYDNGATFASEDDFHEFPSALSLFGSRRWIPQRRCMSMDSQGTGIGCAMGRCMSLDAQGGLPWKSNGDINDD